MADFKLDQIQSGSSGIDSFFASEPQMITPHGQKVAAVPKKPARVKVGSLSQLAGFSRLSAETLIHKSTKDLWSLTREGEDLYIQRLFSDSDGPIKG